MKSKRIAMLGTGFISDFYTSALHSLRSDDRVVMVYSRSLERSKKFAEKWDIPRWTDDLEKAVNDPEIDTVIIGLPNDLHLDSVKAAAAAGKAILCTKPLGRTAAEAKQMLDAVEEAGVFHGYMEDLAYTHKTLKALTSVKNGALGDILWVRSRETHPGPHSDWFWNNELSGGGAIVDLGCHCIEIARNFIGKDIRPVEVMCWADTQVKPIDAEDHGIGLVKYENGAIGQFEVSWNFRGGMDLRDEVSGVEGYLRMDHFLRTGFEMFTAVGEQGYVAEKAETNTGWLFPVGDEIGELGYDNMFYEMFNAIDKGTEPMETFYDGYIVNAVIDACYKSAKSKKWEPVELEVWRGRENVKKISGLKDYDEDHYLVKTEKLPDGSDKIILKNKKTGKISQIHNE
ncbi:MAG: Gfo/Idh/MocA family oxidoreductase [Cyclobacteriaceae bacterium]|nr:Gfo/Idh/MocA family oxidoreductase [Cyclobacteriaceae bacterium]